MLDVRPTAYIVPMAEQTIGPLTPTIRAVNSGDEDALVTGLVRIYRASLGTMIYDSVLQPTTLIQGQSANITTETEFDPGAPADDDYFCLCEITAVSTLTGNSQTRQLGQFYFDVTPSPMGPVPATHHATHEIGGMDEVNATGLRGAALKATYSEVSNATPTPDADHYGQYCITALAEAADFQVPLTAPTNGEKLIIRITDDATPRALTWDPIYQNRGATLPATTVSTKTHYIGLIYNAALATWDCVAATVEA
jgi:hypothetical protein